MYNKNDMQEKIANLNPRNIIVSPGGKIEIALDVLVETPENFSVNYQLVNFKTSGSKEIADSGSFKVKGGKSAKIAFDAPAKLGDYRFYVACDGQLERRPVRVIVSDVKIEAAPGINLLAEETELLSGFFWRHQQVNILKALRSKIFGTKIIFCLPVNNGGAGGVIVKLGCEYELRDEYLNINVLCDEFEGEIPAAIPKAGDYLFSKGKAAILYKYNENVIINDAITLLDWIEGRSEDEICLTLKLLLNDILGEALYKDPVSKSAVSIFKEYSEASPGNKIFGVYRPAPAVKIEAEGMETIVLSGEAYDKHPEKFAARGKILKVYDKAVAVLDQQSVGHQYTVYLKNPEIKKEKLIEAARNNTISFNLLGAPPLSMQEFFAEFIAAENVQANFITDILKEFKKELLTLKTTTVHGNLHPRNIVITDDGTILLIDFESVGYERHVLTDFAKLETYFKLWGLFPLISGNKSSAQDAGVEKSQHDEASDVSAALEFEKSLDGQGAPGPKFLSYMAAIEEIRKNASGYLVKKGEWREYQIALFMTELSVLKHHHGAYSRSRAAQMIAAIADRRARNLLGKKVQSSDTHEKAAGASSRMVEASGYFLCVEPMSSAKGIAVDSHASLSRMTLLLNDILRPIKKNLSAGSQVIFNPSSDIILLSFINTAPEDTLNFLINFATRIAREKIPARAGVHCGSCRIEKSMTGEIEATGAGPDTAVMVSSLGKSGHLLASEQFYKLFAASPMDRVFEKMGSAKVNIEGVSGLIYTIVTAQVGNINPSSKIGKRSEIKAAKTGKTRIGPVIVDVVPAAPVETFSAGLTAISEPYAGMSFPLRTGVNKIGRSSKCAICFKEIPFISAQHAEIEFDGKKLVLKDLESTNGTFVNDKKTSSAELKNGDIIMFARIKFRVEIVKN